MVGKRGRRQHDTSSPWKKSSGRFSTDENLRFSRTLRVRHVIPDVQQAVCPQPANNPAGSKLGAASARRFSHKTRARVRGGGQRHLPLWAEAEDSPMCFVNQSHIGVFAVHQLGEPRGKRHLRTPAEHVGSKTGINPCRMDIADPCLAETHLCRKPRRDDAG